MIEFQTARPNPDYFEVKDIDPQELSTRLDQVAVIDVRQPEEFTGELGHLKGARLMVLDTLPSRMNDIPRDKTVVFVCRSGGRSARATAWALSEGFKDVYNLKGGMILWQKLRLVTE